MVAIAIRLTVPTTMSCEWSALSHAASIMARAAMCNVRPRQPVGSAPLFFMVVGGIGCAGEDFEQHEQHAEREERQRMVDDLTTRTGR